jgi:hypothetical protein
VNARIRVVTAVGRSALDHGGRVAARCTAPLYVGSDAARREGMVILQLVRKASEHIDSVTLDEPDDVRSRTRRRV